jgi:hypothetical protein
MRRNNRKKLEMKIIKLKTVLCRKDFHWKGMEKKKRNKKPKPPIIIPTQKLLERLMRMVENKREKKDTFFILIRFSLKGANQKKLKERKKKTITEN